MPLEEISMDIMKRIASWLEGMPMFYDLADPNYKNTQLRDMKLTEFGGEIGLSAAAIKHHFVSRSNKLIKDTKMKSGSGGGKRMTPLQSFKLAAYAFLDPTTSLGHSKKHAERSEAMMVVTAWAEWLVSVLGEIPEAHYRDYQADSFNLGMRYIMHAQQPQLQLQPQPQQQQLQAFQPVSQFLPFNAHPVCAQQQSQQQPFAQVETSCPARAQSAPAPSVPHLDLGTNLSMGVSPGSSTSMINQAWTLSDQLASPM